MSAPLLATKLYIPPVRPELVSRPRLIEKLNRAMKHRLTLISAPAGFGKTTLLGEWIANTHPRIAWLSLDEGDNDLNRFLVYLIAALQTVDGNLGSSVLDALQAPAEVRPEVVLTILINDMASLPSGLVLVLDDYHIIESPPVDQSVTFLLENLPPQLKLVLASRIDPSLPLSRLRARGQMDEIRESDLRFTPDEAAAFLDQALRLDLPDESVAALSARTEGWIAGLQLAALSMQGLKGDSQIAGFINRFAGSDRYIQDYLTDEVLQRRPKGTQEFLLQTSILERLSGPLCDSILSADAPAEQNGSQAILRTLEAANLFIVPLDHERQWYRYHHLFADLLRQRLRWTMPERVPELHNRASAWYEKQGLINDAFHHAQAAGDCERAAELVEHHWQGIVHRGELRQLEGMLDSLGPECTTSCAPLSMAYCWIHALRGTIEAIPNHLEDIRQALDDGGGVDSAGKPMQLAVIPSLVETMEAIVSLDRDQARSAKEHAERAIALIPESASATGRGLLHGAAGFRLAQAHKELGEYEESCAVLLDVLVMLKASENYYGVAGTIVQIATMYQALGRTREAITLCQDTLGWLREHGRQTWLPSGMVHVALADLQVEAGDRDEARKNLEIGRGPVEQMQSQAVLNLVAQIDAKLGGSSSSPQALIEPLSSRELEVLRLVAQGHSNREISERLFLAMSTVKGHNRKIFAKLQVRRRTEAVARAREMELL